MNGLNQRIQLQLERLHKNYLQARTVVSPLAFYELAHTLRVWTEIADNKEQLGDWYNKKSFRCAKPQKKNSRLLKKTNSEYIWLYSAHFNHGEVIQTSLFMPDQINFSSSKITVQSEISIGENGGLNGIRGCFLGASIEGLDIKKIDVTDKLTLTQFLGGEIISINHHGKHERYSTKFLIQRTANELTDSSHFQDNAPIYSERIEGAITLLKSCKIGNISILYFLLLYAAQEILIAFKKIDRVQRPPKSKKDP